MQRQRKEKRIYTFSLRGSLGKACIARLNQQQATLLWKPSILKIYHRTPLLTAIRHKNDIACYALIKLGANVNAQDKDGNTPLRESLRLNLTSISVLLVAHGANVEDENVAEVSEALSAFFHEAAAKGDTSNLAFALEAGVEINATAADGLTALHAAAGHHQLNAVKWLLIHGADVSAAANNGQTPLHSSASRSTRDAIEQLQVLKLLLVKGADPIARTRGSQTPQDIARQCRSHAAVDVLQKAELAWQLIAAEGEDTRATAVTIRFGGPPGAGKSTLTDALQVKRNQHVFRRESQTDEGATNAHKRTKGINCQTFTDENSAHFAIFNLGGQGEFLVSHQMFMGDGSVPVIDCVVISALDNALEENALKWCSLFASRNQPTSTPWPLLLIATRADTASEQDRATVFAVFCKIKEKFADYFHFLVDKPLFIDARKSWSELTITLRRVLSQLRTMLVCREDLPRQPAICKRITDHLPSLRKETKSPVITKEKFIDFMRPRVMALDKEQSELSISAVTSLFDTALQFLTGSATILAFDQEHAKRYVVIDPHWLLSNVVGRVLVSIQ